jgi:hypothetical protein
MCVLCVISSNTAHLSGHQSTGLLVTFQDGDDWVYRAYEIIFQNSWNFTTKAAFYYSAVLNGQVTFRKSAWNHMPGAITICTTGVANIVRTIRTVKKALFSYSIFCHLRSFLSEDNFRESTCKWTVSMLRTAMGDKHARPALPSATYCPVGSFVSSF